MRFSEELCPRHPRPCNVRAVYTPVRTRTGHLADATHSDPSPPLIWKYVIDHRKTMGVCCTVLPYSIRQDISYFGLGLVRGAPGSGKVHLVSKKCWTRRGRLPDATHSEPSRFLIWNGPGSGCAASASCPRHIQKHLDAGWTSPGPDALRTRPIPN